MRGAVRYVLRTNGRASRPPARCVPRANGRASRPPARRVPRKRAHPGPRCGVCRANGRASRPPARRVPRKRARVPAPGAACAAQTSASRPAESRVSHERARTCRECRTVRAGVARVGSGFRFEDELHRVHGIRRRKIGAAVLLRSIAGQDQDGAGAGAPAAFDIGALVADEVRPRQVDIEIAAAASSTMPGSGLRRVEGVPGTSGQK